MGASQRLVKLQIASNEAPCTPTEPTATAHHLSCACAPSSRSQPIRRSTQSEGIEQGSPFSLPRVVKLTRRRAGRTAGAQQPAQQEAACFQSLYMSNRLFSSIIQTFCRCKLAPMLCAAAARPAIRHAAALQPLSRPPRLRSTQPSQLRPAATGDDLLVAHLLEQPPEHFVAVDAHSVEAGAAQLVGVRRSLLVVENQSPGGGHGCIKVWDQGWQQDGHGSWCGISTCGLYQR